MLFRRKPRDQADRKQAVIFDFDGTIADSMRAIVQVFEDLTGRHGRYTDADIDNFRSLTVPELIKALEVPGWKVPILIFRGRRMLKAHMHGIAVHEGMTEVIKTLYKRGVPLYVLSSNSTENVQKYLQWHKLSPYFRSVRGGVSVFGKAASLFSLFDKQGIDPTTSWYVGDETRDVIAAKAVGLKIASVTWGYSTHAALVAKEPNAVVDTAKELSKVLEDTWKK